MREDREKDDLLAMVIYYFTASAMMSEATTEQALTIVEVTDNLNALF
jgi:hypothetical protein